MSAPTDPRIGTELSGYRIDELVGQGGMGIVYKAWDKALERTIALKLIKPELAEDQRFRARFLRESRIAASIDHSHIVPIHDAGEWEGELYIAMRYVEGSDLKELLASDGPLEPDRALAILAQAASALDAAHERGLVHRDVKPANILITAEAGRNEHVYLSDFGLSKPASSQEEGMASVQLSGSSDYAAPEQIEGKTVNRETDVYSLGCVLYECLAGEVPFRSSSPVGVLFGHLSSPPPSLSEKRPALGSEINAVVAKALAKEPEERYESCSELVGAAQQALLPEPGVLDRIGREGIVALALVGAVILAAAIVPTLLLTGGEEASGTTVITQPSLQKIDPETNELVETIELNAIPDDMAVGAGAVWLLDIRDRLLMGLSPETGEVRIAASLSEVGQRPSAVAVVNDTVMATFRGPLGGAGDSIWLYDPASESLSRALSVGAEPDTLATGFGDMWFVGYPGNIRDAGSALIRASRAESEPRSAIDLVTDDGARPAAGEFVAQAGESSIWIVSAFQRPGEDQIARGKFMLWRVDPSADELVANREVAGEDYDLAVGADSVWVSVASDDVVHRIDSSGLGLDSSIRVGRNPEAISYGLAAVWVANARDGSVSRIDPESLDVTTINVGGTPSTVVAGEDGVWVIVRPQS